LGHWVRFFLEAIIQTSEEGKGTFDAILKLVEEYDAAILKLNRRASKARLLLQTLYRNPVISVNETAEKLNIKFYAANQLIRLLVELGILQEITGYSRNRIYILQKYVEIFSEKTQ